MSDLSVEILKEMRDEIRGLRSDNAALRQDMVRELTALRQDMKTGFEQANARFEVIEATLRDLAQQLVMLSRAVKVALEARGPANDRMEDLERRVTELERKTSP